MENSFEDLIVQFGVPKIVIPNTPRLLYLGQGSFVVGENPEKEIDPQYKIYHRRFKYGETEFLAVKSRIEVYKNEEKKLLENLEKRNLKPVEFVYSYKEARARDYPTGDWKNDKVAVATDADVKPLSREDLLEAIEEKRVLWVCGWSSMGDKYVDFHIGSADFLPKDHGYHFLFEKPCRLTGAMLAGMGDDYESEEEFFNYHLSYFTRAFLSDK